MEQQRSEEHPYQEVSYKPGEIVTIPTEASQHARTYEIMTIRYEQGNILVRSEAGPPFLREQSAVLVEVWSDEALYRFIGIITHVSERQQGMFVHQVAIQDVDVVQRRADARYDTHYPASFVPYEKQSEFVQNNVAVQAVGHAINVGLGGMQLATTVPLEELVVGRVHIVTSVGMINAQARIVTRIKTETNGYRYGMEFIKLDTSTKQKLHRLTQKKEEALHKDEQRDWRGHRIRTGRARWRRG